MTHGLTQQLLNKLPLDRITRMFVLPSTKWRNKVYHICIQLGEYATCAAVHDTKIAAALGKFEHWASPPQVHLQNHDSSPDTDELGAAAQSPGAGP